MVRFLESRQGRREANTGFPEMLVTMLEPTSAASEAYRTLRTSLFYSQVDTPPKVIVITSPGAREGKSTTCANLAVVLAQAGKNTLLMDCNLRRPMMHKIFGLRNFSGVVSALVATGDLPESGWHEPMPGLRVATSGPIPHNPAELLGSKRFADLLRRAREEFDYVLIDAPPTGETADSVILARQADGVLMVIDSQNTRKRAVRQMVRSLKNVRASILGVVMNNVTSSTDRYYGYGG